MEATETVPYAAVTPRGRILYNPEAIEKLSVEEIVFLLCHEVLHIAFSHSLRRGEREHYLFNIASDAVINEMLIELEIGKFIDSGVRLRGAQSRTAEDIYDETLKENQLSFELKMFNGQTYLIKNCNYGLTAKMKLFTEVYSQIFTYIGKEINGGHVLTEEDLKTCTVEINNYYDFTSHNENDCYFNLILSNENI